MNDGSAENAGYLLPSAFSTACVNSAESGFTFESNRFRIFPSRPIRNLLKFHLMSPGNGEPSPANNTSSEWRFGPLTSILSNSGKVTWYLEEQNCFISSLDPGS